MSDNRPIRVRFMAHVEKTDTCWLWTASCTENGYGRFKVSPRHMMAHRASYELFVGRIPDGLQIDHLCHTADPTCDLRDDCPHRRCVRPDHLEAVTLRENMLRSPHTLNSISAAKTHCPQGHPYDEANTYVCPDGRRDCRTCRREAGRRRDARARGMAA